jgi:signal transduction histidine kinase
MGVFIVGSTLEPVNLSSELINVSRTLASLSALALRNAQLYRDGQHHATQLEQSLVERMRAETERKTLEAQLIQAQKMESVGRLAGGVALDFNNMLAVILGHASLAVETLQAGHPLHGHLTQILTAAERSSDLTRQLLAFARKQTIDPKVLNLNEVIGNMLQMLRRLIGEDIHLSRLPDPDLGFVQLDPAQVDQILANLCVNARDAISGIGKVTIETANSRFDRTYCDEHPGFRPGNYVMIAVSDDGAGMDEETQAMIFEPFFTTKEAGKGTGLGLATVYGIAKQNKGFVNVYSEPGHGTTIRIYLPRQEETSEYEQIERNGQDLEGGNETVLLVEDEDMVLRLGKEMLESLGYSVRRRDARHERPRTLRKARELLSESQNAVHLGLHGQCHRRARHPERGSEASVEAVLQTAARLEGPRGNFR